MSTSEYGTAASNALDRPRNCFRLHVGEDYLANYTVSLSPKDAGIAWGSSVKWTTDPFEDIECDATMPMMAAEDLDVCALFADEVDDMHADKIGYDTQMTASDGATGGNLTGFQLKVFTAPATGEPGERYNAMWYHDGTKTGTKNGVGSNVPTDLYRNYEDGAANDKAVAGEDERGTVWVAGGWVDLVDDDGDPIHGDLGKVDIHAVGDADTGADVADNYPATNTDAQKCSAADGGTAVVSNADDTVKTVGTLCDAEDVEIETSVTYTDNFGDQACSVTVSYTLTCDWDASGEMGVRRGVTAPDATTGLAADGTNEARFLSCTVAKN